MENNCPDCERTLPCCRHCTTCGRIVNHNIFANNCSPSKHLGYTSQARHHFCPDCGKILVTKKES